MNARFTRLAVYLAGACALISLFCVLAPVFVMSPFWSQGPREIPFALTVERIGPVVTAVCLILAIATVIPAWPRTRASRARTVLAFCLPVTLLGVWLTRINVFEIVFHPYTSPAFGAAGSAGLDDTDMVMSITLGGETHAYPIGAMGYHHVVNDVVGGVPVAATYCSLCHTGIIWNRVLDGRLLSFHLGGIRNGNALLLDQETNSIWQQSTGVAIFGPLKGKQLELMHSDELTFALWRTEQPRGLILKPDPRFVSFYANKGWEKFAGKFPSVIDTSKSGIQPRELMLGITTASASKAFPWNTVLAARLIQDRVGTDPVLLVVGPDNLSVRAFHTQPQMTFLRHDGLANGLMTDAETSSVWNFSGCAVSGTLAGQCLQSLDAVKDYWFDWHNYHPSGEVFRN